MSFKLLLETVTFHKNKANYTAAEQIILQKQIDKDIKKTLNNLGRFTVKTIDNFNNI